jgi:hypothetical protein
MTDKRHISEEDLALYAMQALAREEMEAARAHVSECDACRGQLAEISGDLAMVAMSVEQQPVPSGARQRLMDRIAAEPNAAAPAQDSHPTRVPDLAVVRKKKSRASWRWVPWAAVAALLILSANLFIRVKFLDQQLEMQNTLLAARNAENARAHAVLDVLTAADAQHIVLTAGKTRPAPTARAVYLASRGSLVLEASNMQALPPDKTYELWVIPTSGAPIPAGTFRPDPAGSGSVVLPHIPPGLSAKAFGITVENAGGSDTPTLPIVLAGSATAGE